MGLGSSGTSNTYTREGLVIKVNTSGALPTQANDGDLAVTLDDNKLYFYDTSSSTWIDLTLGGGGGTDTYRTEYKVLSADDIVAKQISLANTPVSSSGVSVDIVGGAIQKAADDFVVSGNLISWSSKALDGVLEENDVIRISYTY